MTRLLRFAPAFASILLAACATPQAARQAAAPVEIGIVAINDFHGALEPPRQAVPAPDGMGGSAPVPAGGAAWLASAIDSIKAKHANHVVVAAGDLTSASQLASSIYLDEPAVGVMNRVGLEFNAVGNHEFDRGRRELLRLQNGGCEKNTTREPCQIEAFKGAAYKYLSASTITEDGSTLFPATGLKSFGTGASKVTIGFIGLSLKAVPELVSPDGIKGLTFADEADTINRAVPLLKQQGADAVVVLIHQGGKTTDDPDPNGCKGMTGEILPILARLDPRVDVVVSGHTHWAYVCNYGDVDPARPILLTSAGVYGELVTDITLTIDPAADRVVAKAAHNVIVQSPGYTGGRGAVPNSDRYPRFAPRADVGEYVQRYVDAASAYARQPVGHLSGPAEKPDGLASNTGGLLGNLLADAHLAATRDAGARIAFTNPFGIRAPLVPAADGSVTFGQIYAVQPFNNTLITETLTGAEIRQAIEEGLDDSGAQQMLAPSANVRVTYDMTRPSGQRVVALTIDGQPIDPAATYRVAINNFLAGGGDGYATFARGTDARIGMSDLDALAAWLAAVPVRQVPPEERTVRLDK
ncbi:bifunctional metallophosphatase/5'-nucleotidase [Novosphingobium album (ex Liu et al. 2023)]|uniref:Bifunctional metallophosphatase/5'-nucleotidase n=1 Tax=Novosphingobium album (ex Liu et al. 2023) TaxID=3031130 RepID=A0ABT5WL09_9SPHN|nr:bifunctional metallophosphatase/5'-nucleotidase [Novosphingobium album (ex Liu et al. 2023)]MDE8650718.1 bifunctional metallophosphatase/5'-nucleotidase [Novosphingobium album (ex Liu et al. 2023)]